MTKKHEYPWNTHIVPRLQAVIRGYSSCRSTLEMVKEYLLPMIKPGGEVIPAIVERAEINIDDALRDADISLRAIAGEDSE